MTTSYPLSLSQQSVLRNAGRARADRPMAVWEIDPGTGIDAIRARYAELTQAHPILRATVGGRGRRAKLEIADHAQSDVVIEVDLATDANPYDRVAELLWVSAGPAEGPLVAIAVVRTSSATLLAVSGSPLIVDDAALDALAAALLGGAELIDYLSDSAATPQLAQWSSGTPATEYWANRLAGAPDAGDIDGARDRFVRSITAQRWADLTRAVGQPDDVAVLAALAASSMVSGGHEADVIIGIGVAGGRGVLGPATNYLPLRLSVSDADTPATLTAKADAGLRALTANSDVRGEWLHHRHGVDGRLFDVVLAVDTAARAGVHHRIGFRPESASRVVRLELSGESGALSVDTGVGASADLPTAERLSAALVRRGRRWIAAPEALLSAIDAEAANDDGADVAGWPVPRTTDVAVGPAGGALETERELVLAEAIRAVLELSADAPIGRGDTFFSLGGDSVGALKVVTAVGERGYAIDVESVFTHPEIAEIAARMTEDAAASTAEPQAVQALSASGLDPAALAALSGEFATGPGPQ